MQGMMPVKTKSRVPENMGVASGLVDARAKQVLREAVDAVVNSFAKHSQGYGRGIYNEIILCLILFLFRVLLIVYIYSCIYSKCRGSIARILADETS